MSALDPDGELLAERALDLAVAHEFCPALTGDHLVVPGHQSIAALG